MKSAAARRMNAVQLGWPEWTEEALLDGVRVWRDADGDVLSVTARPGPFTIVGFTAPDFQEWCRTVAHNMGAGLIECHADGGKPGAMATLIYKKRDKLAYSYTGMLFMTDPEFSLVWTAVAAERGTTGVREAVVAGNLFNAGRLNIEDYERRWARDPYDPTYLGHDRSVLRFISDHQIFDCQFPQHPLSKIRRVMSALRDRKALN